MTTFTILIVGVVGAVMYTFGIQLATNETAHQNTRLTGALIGIMGGCMLMVAGAVAWNMP